MGGPGSGRKKGSKNKRDSKYAEYKSELKRRQTRLSGKQLVTIGTKKEAAKRITYLKKKIKEYE
ncbi:MAG: hypothetical protein PHE29_02095 [Tissierellia bacterium]|nr:hypothetical protein [Tissierellia bacterium]